MRIEFDSTEEFLGFMRKIIGDDKNIYVGTGMEQEISNIKDHVASLDSDIKNVTQKFDKIIIGNTEKEIKEEVVSVKTKKPAKTKNHSNDSKFTRKYSKTAKKNLPKTITKMTDDGHFILSHNSKKTQYGIQSILKLRKLLFDKNPMSFREMSELVPEITKSQIPSFCYGVESGFFDKYINDWEQRQANKFYSNATKTIEPVNNPEKRKSMGM